MNVIDRRLGESLLIDVVLPHGWRTPPFSCMRLSVCEWTCVFAQPVSRLLSLACHKTTTKNSPAVLIVRSREQMMLSHCSHESVLLFNTNLTRFSHFNKCQVSLLPYANTILIINHWTVKARTLYSIQVNNRCRLLQGMAATLTSDTTNCRLKIRRRFACHDCTSAVRPQM